MVSIGRRDVVESALELNIGGLPPFSARGCSQKLWVLHMGSFQRTIEGILIYLGQGVKKYRTKIEGSDGEVLATAGLVPGCEVTLGCIQHLWQHVAQSFVTLERIPVKGSVVGIDHHRKVYNPEKVQEKNVTFSSSFEEGFVRYRPLLRMKVLHYELCTVEWDATCRWTLELEEI